MASAQLRLLIPIWQVNNNKVCPIKVVGTFLPKKTLSCNLESKTHCPFLKTFAWRLIRRAIASAKRAARYSTHIDKKLLCLWDYWKWYSSSFSLWLFQGSMEWFLLQLPSSSVRPSWGWCSSCSLHSPNPHFRNMTFFSSSLFPGTSRGHIMTSDFRGENGPINKF